TSNLHGEESAEDNSAHETEHDHMDDVDADEEMAHSQELGDHVMDEDDDDDDDTDDDDDDGSTNGAESSGSPSRSGPSSRPAGGTLHGASKKSHQKPFLPEYLKYTAFGQFQRCKELCNLAADGRTMRQEYHKAADSLAMAHVAPDLFFKSLVQDSWPHYCTPVPNASSVAGLRLGYEFGLGSQVRTMLSASTPRAPEVQSPANPRSSAPKAVAEPPDLPSQWQQISNDQFLAVGADRVSVRYTGPGKGDSDARMIRSDHPIPARCGVYYYEVFIRSRGQCGYIGIGLSHNTNGATRLPGWDPGSWGYHGDDGNCFSGNGSGRAYGPGFTTDDTVGCGIDFKERSIFFTRNGLFLGHAFKSVDTSKPIFPAIGMRTAGEHIVANFGQRPFRFDIECYVSEAHQDALAEIHKTSIGDLIPKPCDQTTPPEAKNAADPEQTIALDILKLRDTELGIASQPREMSTADAALSTVISYLLHKEYYASARALIENIAGKAKGDAGGLKSARLTQILETLSKQSARLDCRKAICKHISQGDIDSALGMLQESYPQVLKDESLVFQLRCRQFIELVRAANGYHIADCIPSDDSLSSASSGSMMDVDDTQAASLMSLAAITNAPAAPTKTVYGQIPNLRKLEPARLVRILLDYGRQLQADYGASPNPIVREGLVHTFSLLAYADPAASPISALLDPEACKPLARLVECAIVATEKAPRMSALECIYRQCAALLAELSSRRNGAAALVSVDTDFV
ncbi:hypothetical protein EC988_005252, partial [Linderina pennispora]